LVIALKKLSSSKRKKANQGWWHMHVIPTIQEDEAEGFQVQDQLWHMHGVLGSIVK
jgi:hypothetical protein